MIYGSRIRQARELCGFTQIELAKRIGVRQASIAQFENDQSSPSQNTLVLIAKETEFSPSFFEQEPIDNFPLGSLCYRARNSLSKKDEAQAYQYAKTMYEQIRKMQSLLKLPKPRLPTIQEKPQVTAKVVRTSLGLSPDEPIRRLIRILEKNGVIILTLPLNIPKLDSFSIWVTNSIEQPIIAITAGRPADRLRFNIGHEIGHLVMHQSLKGKLTSAEKDANKFAGEFLLPEVAMRRELVAPITLSRILALKIRWGISMQSLIYRAHELEIISDRQYSYLFEQMSARGWRTREPGEVEPEIPVAYRKMIELSFEDPDKFTRDMHLTKDRAERLMMFS